MSFSHLPSFFLCLLLILGAIEAFAQTPAENASAPASITPTVTRLAQLDSTYLFSLRKFHGPVLLDYQRDLERLKQLLIARNRPDDAKHVDAEIEYVKTLITTTGVLPYTALIPPPPEQPAPENSSFIPPRGRKKMPDTPALSLNAAETNRSSLPMNAKAEGLPIGSAEWPVKKLPAGNYDVVMFFSCASLEKPEKITLRFAGQEFNTALPIERVTGSDLNYRPYRIAKIVLDQEVTDGTLSIQGEAPASPHLFIRGIFLLKRE